jgi:chromosome segregation ATPase
MAEEITHQFPKDGFNLILARLDSIDSRLVTLDSRLTTLESRLTTLESVLTTLESRLSTLEEKVDKRLMETRPIWEQVLVRLGSIESRLDRIDDELHDQSRKFRLFLKDVVRLQDDQEDLDERVQKLESTPTT